ncbi:hypothetical protein [Crocinitomix catalasitica]|uniref:hypothetical protein n=1 Tax=Crocinitomix catalasitica TaxID=184607 RepID=UPI000482E152|nr:hypothetical protein [Crocinitomix catalasitica]
MKLFKSLLFVLFVQATTFAQEGDSEIVYGSATSTENCCITLDASSPIQEYYKADLSVFGFENEAAAEKLMGFKSNNLVSLKADYANNVMLIRIHTDRTSTPNDIVWWNDYLKSICK